MTFRATVKRGPDDEKGEGRGAGDHLKNRPVGPLEVLEQFVAGQTFRFDPNMDDCRSAAVRWYDLIGGDRGLAKMLNGLSSVESASIFLEIGRGICAARIPSSLC